MKENIYLIKNGMEKNIIKMEIYFVILLKEMEKEKNIMNKEI